MRDLRHASFASCVFLRTFCLNLLSSFPKNLKLCFPLKPFARYKTLGLKMANLSDLVGCYYTFNIRSQFSTVHDQRQADFHPAIWISRLPNRTPDKLKDKCFFSWHSIAIEDSFKIQVQIIREMQLSERPAFVCRGATVTLFAPRWLDALLSIIQSA